MSLASRDAQVYLGLNSAGVWGGPGAPTESARWVPCISPLDGWAQACRLLAEKGTGVRRTRLWLSGALVRPFVLQSIEGLRNATEAFRLATAVAPERTGLDGTCAVWMDRWRPGEATACAAMNQELRNEIEASCAPHRRILSGLGPWWVMALRSVLADESRSTRLVAIDDTDAVTILCGRGGEFTSAMSVLPKPDHTQIRPMVARMASSEDIAPGESVFACLPPEGSGRNFEAQSEVFL